MKLLQLLHELYQLYKEPTQGPSGDKFGQKIDEIMQYYDRLFRSENG